MKVLSAISFWFFFQVVSSQTLRGINPEDIKGCSKKLNKDGIPLCKGIWRDCGSLFTVQDVRISTFRRPNQNKIPLFHKTNTQICIKGVANNIRNPVTGILNAAHGEILSLKKDFCEIPKDGCKGMKYGCPINPGDSFEYCSTMEVPNAVVELDVDVYWRLLEVPQSINTCQKQFETERPQLICLKIPAALKSRDFLKRILEARSKGK